MKKHLLAPSVYLRLRDRLSTLKEIKIASLIGLLDVLHVKLAVTARIDALRCAPRCAAARNLVSAHVHVELLLWNVQFHDVALF